MAPLLTSLTTIINQFGIGAVSAPSGGGGFGSPLGLTATGGVISDYTSGPAVYRAHVFTSSGTFAVSSLGSYGSNVEYLVVAGGGGGGLGGDNATYQAGGGGGGAGGLLSTHPDVPAPLRQTAVPVSTSPGSYTVTIGAGGGAGSGASSGAGAMTNGKKKPNYVLYLGILLAVIIVSKLLSSKKEN